MGGAKNCPETPRQKMIGMMYLVLTAMLALNVSTDILNGFTLVDRAIMRSTATTEDRNLAVYEDLNVMYQMNPTKVGKWFDEAKVVKEHADSMYNYLQGFKNAIIRLSDGEDADVENPDYEIVGKSNLDVAGQYTMVMKTGDKLNGDILKDRIGEYKEFLLGYVQGDSTKIKEFTEMFATNPGISSHDGEQVPWVEYLFEGMPLAGAVTIVSKMQSDVRQAELEVISHLKGQTDASDFRVNKLGAFVATVSDYVMKGEVYNATIMLSAVDSTKSPLYYVNGKKLERDVYTVPCSTPGVYSYSGEILLPNNGDTARFPFQRTYTVGEPSATIANEDMNVVYRGYDNKLNIAVSGVSDDKIQVVPTGADVKKVSAGHYICRPTSQANVVLTVYANTDAGKKKMGEHTFRTLRLPNPSAFVEYKGKNGENYLYPSSDKVPSRMELKNSQRVVAQYSDGLLKANFTITKFTIYAQDATGAVTPAPATSDRFTAQQVKVISGKKAGQRLVIEDIKAKGPDGVERDLSPISIPIK